MVIAYIAMLGKRRGEGERIDNKNVFFFIFSWSMASNKDNRNVVMMWSEMKKSTLFHDIRIDNGILIHS